MKSSYIVSMPHSNPCKTVRDFLTNIRSASVVIGEDMAVPSMMVLDSKNNLKQITPKRYINTNDGQFFYLTITPNDWIYLYDLDAYIQLDGKTIWYGTHYTIGFVDSDPDIVKFHITRYSGGMQRLSSYCDFKLSDLVKDVHGNPPCYDRQRVITEKGLEHILNNVRDKTRSHIRSFFKFGLTYRAQPPATRRKINDEAASPQKVYLICKRDGKRYEVQTGPRGGKFITMNSKIIRINASTADLFDKVAP